MGGGREGQIHNSPYSPNFYSPITTYANDLKGHEEIDRFDYSCVSILYYMALEDFANKLIYIPYLNDVLTPNAEDVIRKSLDFSLCLPIHGERFNDLIIILKAWSGSILFIKKKNLPLSKLRSKL